MAGVNIDVNIDGLVDALIKSGVSAVKAAGQAINEEAQLVFEKSQDLVPVDLGTLKDSGDIFPLTVQGDTVEIQIGYGGQAKDYALAVHERVYTESGKKVNHKEPTQAKYLERPAMEAQATLGPRILKRLEDKLNGGGF